MKMELIENTSEATKRLSDKTIVYSCKVIFNGRHIADTFIRKVFRKYKVTGKERRVYEVWDTSAGLLWTGLSLTKAKEKVRLYFVGRKHLVGLK